MISRQAFLYIFISSLHFPPQHTKQLLFLTDPSPCSHGAAASTVPPSPASLTTGGGQKLQELSPISPMAFPNWQHQAAEMCLHVDHPPAVGSAASLDSPHQQGIKGDIQSESPDLLDVNLCLLCACDAEQRHDTGAS